MTKNDLYRMFKDEYQLSCKDARQIFKTLTDEELALGYGLKVMRKGYFVYGIS